eukprot:SAG11_NODE_1303_length_5253_cov_4.283081_5_plen_38_part_00
MNQGRTVYETLYDARTGGIQITPGLNTTPMPKSTNIE